MFIITTAERSEHIMSEMKRNLEWVNRISGMAIIDSEMVGQVIDNVPVAATRDDMVDYIKGQVIDEVFIDIPHAKSRELTPLVMELENMGVSNIITIDAHDPRVQNSIRIGFESVAPTYQMIKAIAKSLNNDIKFTPENTMMISPDEGGMGRCVYYSQVLGVQLGMFYKRRDFSRIVDGRNPIVSHEFLGDNGEGKDVIVVDDMISSGDSMIDVCKQLKNLNARRIFVFSSFGLFSSGLERFDDAFKEGIFDRIFTTNLIYQTPELLTKEWYYSVDMSKYVALIVDTLNHDKSVSQFLNPIQKINDYVEKYNLK